MKQEKIISQGLTVRKYKNNTYSFTPYAKIRKYFLNFIPYSVEYRIEYRNHYYYFCINGYVSRKTEEEALQLLKNCINQYNKNLQEQLNREIIISKNVDYELRELETN